MGNGGYELIANGLAAGEYFVEAYGYNAIGSYEIQAARIEEDFTDNAETTGNIRINSSATGTIDFDGDRDWFAITLADNDLLRFRSDEDLNFLLVDELGAPVRYGLIPANGVAELIVEGVSAGQYFVSVSSDYYANVSDYTLGVRSRI